MTIGIDGSRAFTDSKTGTENYSYQLLKNIASLDTENRYLIYITRSQLSDVRRQTWPDNFEFRVINLHRLWTQVGLAWMTFVDPIDVLFVPSHTLPLIRRSDLKTVITVHDLGAEYLPALHQLKQVLYLRLMTHYQLKTASRIIAVSEATKDDLVRKLRIKESKIQVVYEGVDKSVFRKLSNDVLSSVLSKYKLQKNKYFFFVGTIQPRKNLERVIKAFNDFLKDYPEYKLILAGGRGWDSESIYSLPKELGIEQSVGFIGRVSDEEVVALYNGATALVYPSLFEGFGLPIIEAFACGCPVITSDTSSMPEVAGKAAILVDPYNIEGIYKAMSQLATRDILRSTLIKKGILRSKDFDWKIAAEKTLQVINRVMDKGF